jgi:hypothetical protein
MEEVKSNPGSMIRLIQSTDEELKESIVES